MTTDPVRAIADAVLYEGYVLWPYRRSAPKNRHRFTIGGIYPPAFAELSCDASQAFFECLFEGAPAGVQIEARFLQLVHRQVVFRDAAVEEAASDDRRYMTWDETVERNAFHGRVLFEADANEETISSDLRIVRRWERIDGRIEMVATPLGGDAHRLSVTVTNESACGRVGRDHALRHTMLACHVSLRAREGAFVSPVDPPEHLAQAAAACRARGLWPVLVGPAGSHDTLLASPMILDEYPRIDPATPCDFFDGTEVGELLAASVLALTDEEKAEMRACDPRARAILGRVEALTAEERLLMHGRFAGGEG